VNARKLCKSGTFAETSQDVSRKLSLASRAAGCFPMQFNNAECFNLLISFNRKIHKMTYLYFNVTLKIHFYKFLFKIFTKSSKMARENLILALKPPTTEATTRGNKFKSTPFKTALLRSLGPQRTLPNMAVGTDSFLHLARPLAPSAMGVQPTTAPLNVIIQPQVRTSS
jgi:hypothetical protein